MKLIEEFRKEYEELPEHKKTALKQKFLSSAVLFFLAFLFFLLFFLT